MGAPKKINDLTVHVATVNGSGSQSSNQILMRAIFRMGIPVSGKNLFPSNIQGLPTWFSIRVNENGWTARHIETDILVCMNDGTLSDDVKKAPSKSLIIHHDHMNVPALRKDVTSVGVPFKSLIAKACPEARLRKYAINMLYVGILAELIGIESSAIDEALAQQFKTKEKVIALNRSVIEAGRTYAKEDLKNVETVCKLERRDKTKGKILIEGNTASALGAVFGGCQFMSWYPITPSSSLAESVIHFAKKYRKDKKGKNTVAIVQAEDELAALGMVLGASWMGGRAMTTTSGPGIALMAEFTGYSYYSETPAVIFDIQRVGPSTGLPTRTSQGDILFVATLGHGDSKNVCLYPGTVEECYLFAAKAFDLAEQLQGPIFIVSDLDLGMNSWMSDSFSYPKEEIQRGKVLRDEDQEALANYGRYRDVDNDGIGYRTLPGIRDRRGVFFTRGSGHNEDARYTESSETYVRVMDRLNKKWETSRGYVPHSVLENSVGSSIGVIAYGSTHDAMRESVHLLKERGLEVDYLRLRAYPFDKRVREFIKNHDQIIVVEQNRDAQMKSLMCMEPAYQAFVPKLASVLHYNGLPIPASYIADEIMTLQNLSKRHVG